MAHWLLHRVWPGLLLVAATTGQGVDPAWAADSPCFECHESDVTDPPPDRPYSWSFDWQRFDAGEHADLDCEDCHAAETTDGFEDVPHLIATDSTAGCTDCHGDEFDEVIAGFAASIHVNALDEKFRCEFCHDPHSPRDPEEDLPPRAHVVKTNDICLGCHADAVRYRAVSGTGTAPPDLTQVHDWLPRTGKHKRIVLCICCHTPVDHEGVHEILGKQDAQRRCEACHYQRSPVAAKFLGDPNRTTWITNDVLFGDAYVKGAMRNRVVDGILLGILALAALFAVCHGLLRWLTRRRRVFEPFTVATEPVYDLSLRIWHWGNALLFLTLAVTGLRIHFGGRAEPLLSFETAFHVHNIVGAVLGLWFGVFLGVMARSGNGNSYWHKPTRWLHGIWRQARFYAFGVFRGEPHPFHTTRARRFNPLQQAVYLKMMMLVFPVLVVSGILLLVPQVVPETILGRHGGWVVASIHYLAGFILLIFLFIHLYLTTMGDRPAYLLRGMIDGKHRHHVLATNDGTDDD